MQTITPDEARARFGDLVHAATRTYREFEDSAGGIWRPVYDGGDLAGYRLYKLHRLTKKLPKWWPRSR